jgi:hypothetical protein
MVQTLYFKFSGAEESVEIFTRLNMEPAGRIGIGILELAASILLFVPATIWMGGTLTLGLMSGAIYFHCCTLGINVRGDGGHLFALAVSALLASLLVLIIRRKEIPIINKIV